MAESWGNRYLNEREKEGNVAMIWSCIKPYHATAGILGNMDLESTINPGLWEGLKEGDIQRGFGLVQWTPASNYLEWAKRKGWHDYDDYGRISPQIERLKYEYDHNLQWYQTKEYPLTFKQFVNSTQEPEYLASAFLKNYERAGIAKEELRRQKARHWFNKLTSLNEEWSKKWQFSASEWKNFGEQLHPLYENFSQISTYWHLSNSHRNPAFTFPQTIKKRFFLCLLQIETALKKE